MLTDYDKNTTGPQLNGSIVGFLSSYLSESSTWLCGKFFLFHVEIINSWKWNVLSAAVFVLTWKQLTKTHLTSTHLTWLDLTSSQCTHIHTSLHLTWPSPQFKSPYYANSPDLTSLNITWPDLTCMTSPDLPISHHMISTSSPYHITYLTWSHLTSPHLRYS
jgi:hypothetical protein